MTPLNEAWNNFQYPFWWLLFAAVTIPVVMVVFCVFWKAALWCMSKIFGKGF